MRQYIPFGLFLCYALFFISCKQEIKESKTIPENPNTESSSESAKKPLSPHTSTMAMIGDAHIHIDYSSPGVRDRIIFGGLLAYDQIWQAGAHMATWIESNKDLTIDGKVLPAGKYGFFTIPSKNEWTIIFNSNWNQHGKDDYNEKDDILRFKVKPNLSEEITEHLEYKINQVENNEGAISLAWEKVSISFNFKVNP
ncbi:MAG: hypothetical protein CL596_01695 [Alteromonas sp.]|nr:hypothetical protein [Alteromonas sp.]|tara:strand:- start:2249 stop:2839 length:591 start_codon:yes stop_codon:yes gene_type:complete